VSRLAMPFRYPMFARRRALNASPVIYRRAFRGMFEARVASQTACSILAATNWTNVIKIFGRRLQACEHGREIATEEAEKRTCSGRGVRSLARSMTFPACCDGALVSKYDESSRTARCTLGPRPARRKPT
jgi:hypothetical protein